MTAFVIKLIATAAMLTDHIGAVFASDTPMLLRYIGRMAFPVYAYLIAEGCRHTKHMNQYLFRLGLFALLSEIPFDLAFNQMGYYEGVHINFLSGTNVFYTLFLGAAAIAVYERAQAKRQPWLMLLPLILIPASLLANFLPGNLAGTAGRAVWLVYVAAILYVSEKLPNRETEPPAYPKDILFKLLAVVPAFGLMACGDMFHTDYSLFGVGLIFLYHVAGTGRRLSRVVVCLLGVTLEYGLSVFQFYFDTMDETSHWGFNAMGLYMFIGALGAVVMLALYNGQRGKASFKWAFYAFYPIHLSILVLAAYLIA